MEKDENLKPRKNSRIWLYIITATCGILVIGGIVFAIMYFTNQNQGQETAGNDGTEIVTIGDNTELTTGSVTTTIDGKSITYKAAYVVDGIEAKISSGVFESVDDDEAVFLVINGGSLVIDGDVTINKSGSENFQGQ